jgi:hypothetical protein
VANEKEKRLFQWAKLFLFLFSFLFFCAFLPGRLVIFSFLIITDYDYVVRRI